MRRFNKRNAGKPRISIVADPRFSGGTSSAVAMEIGTISDRADISFHAIESKMFRGRSINGRLQEAFEEFGITPQWDSPVIRGDAVIIHNPSFLKFNERLASRIVCDKLICVTHENFLTPQGGEGFDVERCLELIERSSVCGSRHLAPVSRSNRIGVEGWLAGSRREWGVTPFEWFNICDFRTEPPSETVSDRRGRMSRPGWEKFPATADMKSHFPEGSINRILGGDSYLSDPMSIPYYWEVLPFGTEEVSDFLRSIDFFVYFTNPNWRESFGRVIAEAVSAGKVVITDRGTAENFPGSVVVSDGTDVSEIIRRFVENPSEYKRFVMNAQERLAKFGRDEFLKTVFGGISDLGGGTHAVL